MKQLDALGGLYRQWNADINVVSRRDIDNIYERHVLHSLSIARFLQPVAGSTFLDLGTGGGFPGIPLAILWPECRLHLIDRIGKKIKVASAVAEAIGLKNVTFQHGDSGECHDRFDFVVSRAVMKLDGLVRLVRRNVSPACKNTVPNGLICLKGGDLSEETANVPYSVINYPVEEFFPDEEFFKTKELIYVPMI
ncbi:MAG: 16S rRNA (guanine(527)-N(7))-methyltransferase RsmG [Muribaculaceae bacterium]|nr:16S rRNA (guanine(527)-N(7))-methyltransferase RsmG [Muribaculaceae bacterium]